jgi:hypothetical protein
MGAFMSLTEPNSAAILQFAIEIMPPPIPPAGATRDETPAGRRQLSFDALFSCAVPDDRSKNVMDQVHDQAGDRDGDGAGVPEEAPQH